MLKFKFNSILKFIIGPVIVGILIIYLTTGETPDFIKKIIHIIITTGKTTQYKYLNTYLIIVEITQYEELAQKEVVNLQKEGYNAAYLWIPEYNTLKKENKYAVFIGPFKTQKKCELVTEDYRKKNANAYGTWASNDNRHIIITGNGKVREYKVKMTN